MKNEYDLIFRPQNAYNVRWAREEHDVGARDRVVRLFSAGPLIIRVRRVAVSGRVRVRSPARTRVYTLYEKKETRRSVAQSHYGITRRGGVVPGEGSSVSRRRSGCGGEYDLNAVVKGPSVPPPGHAHKFAKH